MLKPMKQLEVTIDNMHCEACVAKVREALNALPALRIADVQVGAAQVAFDDEKLSAAAVVAAIRNAGFPVKSFKATAS